ncbi:hypothetical protein [Slackia exigua]
MRTRGGRFAVLLSHTGRPYSFVEWGDGEKPAERRCDAVFLA